MKSIKTLIISGVVCGVMALPVSGVAAPGDGEHKQAAAFSLVKSIVCGVRQAAGSIDLRSNDACTALKKLSNATNAKK